MSTYDGGERAASVRYEQLQERFMQNVSHELRTPLNIMIGFAELLRDGGFGSLSEAQLAALAHISKAAATAVRHVGLSSRSNPTAPTMITTKRAALV